MDEDKSVKQNIGAMTVKAANSRLFSFKSIFPLDFFPDQVNLDDQKLTIIHREFFLTSQTITVQLPDLLNVEILSGPLFCTVRIYSKYVTGGHADIPKVRKADGLKLRSLVNDLLAERNANADVNTGGQ